MPETSNSNGKSSAPANGGLSPTRVTGVASRAVVRLLSDQGVPANEVVVTRAERHGSGEGACWAVTVLRGRELASREIPIDLVDQVVATGPCQEWYTEVSHLLEDVGMAFPATA